MSATDIRISGALHSPGPQVDNYLTHSHGVKSWLLSLDHKRIGLMYMGLVLTAFALGGLFAVLLRSFLWTNTPWMIKDHDQALIFYNNMFSLHGALMVFAFMVPAIPAVLGNFCLPIMLGAKDVAFPRLNLLSLYCYIVGGAFFVYVLLGGVLRAAFHIELPGGMGLDTGWTFYTPFSTSKAESGVIPATTGAFILGFSSILTGVNFITTIHTLRPKGMTWFRMPLFLWALYATSIIQILATPVLAITLLLLLSERLLGVGIFDPALGGDPVLYQHFFWFYSHPAVYIMILPAMGVISDVIAVHSRKHIFGYSFIAFSSIALALFGFLVWGHHLFASGQSPMANSIFSLLTFSVAIPSAVKVFNWLATLYRGSIRFTAPMLYAMGFILLFTIGGLTGLFLGALMVDIPLHDTYFVVAHFHYVMMGSTLFAFLAGMYHWFPKMFGKMYNENVGRFTAIIIFIGFNLTFFPQFVMGSHGSPRRWATYPIEFQIYHRLSTVGAFVMAIGLITVLCNWISGIRNGRKAPANPWGGNSLEWHCPSPPPHDNFAVSPVADDPYNLGAWEYDKANREWVLKTHQPGLTETVPSSH
jgi:cytochrome c oxidase subunit 1